ncbi:MAG: glycosyltransferase family 2 protein [Bifidobacterium aquikefiri]|uniref:N-acetylglucosaminyltransferase n=1 Tax=Bifidobacterium aquikefiri TaxID=1653207 RepID=A0A261G6Z5_9BIFI|nr:glycosyltransferase family 2 protein [Bifidobacterium aquikefiri]OZG67200.1 N-acetylglucosaminyltransferase [Bifidobacterium aquikefiri]
MAILGVLDWLLWILGIVSIIYQAVCILTSFVSKPVTFKDVPMDNHYAVLISARNEELVVGNLIRSIHAQSYPIDLIDIWLVADNCTDDTAGLARSMGCHVVERHDLNQIGKGYALTFLLNQINQSQMSQIYDAYFVFDADNLLHKRYIEEMNKAFQSGFKILTSYRNSVNFSENWVSSGSALWFIRESRFLNSSRMVFGSSCHVGGTGFMFSKEIMERNNGWKFHLLTEDLEFTMDSILHGDRIGYCGTAILYDEQPVTFKQSWRQRVRWSKGFLEVFRYYGPSLMRRAIQERDFSAVDLTLLICPFTAFGVLRVVLSMIFVACGFTTLSTQLGTISGYLSGIVLSMFSMMALAAMTIIAERNRIGASNKELFAYCLSFPVYMLSYIPISFQAIFSKPEWKPIEHHGHEHDGHEHDEVHKMQQAQ